MVLTGALSNPEIQEKIERIGQVARKLRGSQTIIPVAPEREPPISELLVALLAAAGEAMRMIEIHAAAEAALGRRVAVSTVKNQLSRDLKRGWIERLDRGHYRSRSH
jgi:hypothetical protein